jgi:hypothetical protein
MVMASFGFSRKWTPRNDFFSLKKKINIIHLYFLRSKRNHINDYDCHFSDVILTILCSVRRICRILHRYEVYFPYQFLFLLTSISLTDCFLTILIRQCSSLLFGFENKTVYMWYKQHQQQNRQEHIETL